MGLPVPHRVEVGVPEPEVCAQIDDQVGGLQHGGDELLGGAVGQTQEYHVATLGGVRASRGEGHLGVGSGQAGVKVGHQGAGLGVTSSRHYVEGRVGRADAQQFRTGEARRAHDAHVHHGIIIQYSEYLFTLVRRGSPSRSGAPLDQAVRSTTTFPTTLRSAMS